MGSGAGSAARTSGSTDADLTFHSPKRRSVGKQSSSISPSVERREKRGGKGKARCPAVESKTLSISSRGRGGSRGDLDVPRSRKEKKRGKRVDTRRVTQGSPRGRAGPREKKRVVGGSLLRLYVRKKKRGEKKGAGTDFRQTETVSRTVTGRKKERSGYPSVVREKRKSHQAFTACEFSKAKKNRTPGQVAEHDLEKWKKVFRVARKRGKHAAEEQPVLKAMRCAGVLGKEGKWTPPFCGQEEREKRVGGGPA